MSSIAMRTAGGKSKEQEKQLFHVWIIKAGMRL
jgi:hypothetical protein